MTEDLSLSQSLLEESESLESLSSSSLLVESVIGDGMLHLHQLYSDDSDALSAVGVEDSSWEKLTVALDPVFFENDSILPQDSEFKFVTSFAAHVHGRILAAIPNLLYKAEGYKKHITFPGVFTGNTEGSGYVIFVGTIEVMHACWKFSIDATLFGEQVFPFILANDVVFSVSPRDLKGLGSLTGLELFRAAGLKRVLGERYLFFCGEFIFAETTVVNLHEMLGRMGRDFTTSLTKACELVGFPKPLTIIWGESYYGKFRDGGPKKFNFRQMYQCIHASGEVFSVPFDDRFAVMAQLSSFPTREVTKSSVLIFHALIEPMLDHMLYEGYEASRTRFNVGQRVRYSIDVGRYKKGPEIMDIQFLRQTWIPKSIRWIFPESYGSATLEQYVMRLPRSWFPVLRISVSRLHVMAYDFKELIVPLENEDFNFLTIPPKWWDTDNTSRSSEDPLYTNAAVYDMSIKSKVTDYSLLNPVGVGVPAIYVKVEADKNFDRCNDGVDVSLLIVKELLIQGNSKGIMEAIISLIAEVNVACMRLSIEDWLMDNSSGRFNDLNFTDKLWKVMHEGPKVFRKGNGTVTKCVRKWEVTEMKKKSIKWMNRLVDPVLGRSTKRYAVKRIKKLVVKKKMKNLNW